MGGLKVIVDIRDLFDVYEREVSISTKNKNKIYRFDKYKMINIVAIKEIIESGCYDIAHYHVFYIYEPKLRIIMSLDIKDRIIDHYVAKFILLPKLEKYLDIRNVASRKDMGMNYGLKLLKKYIEKNKKYDNFYVLKLDIKKYFYTISHRVLKEMLRDVLTLEEYELICAFIDSTDKEYVNERIIKIKEDLVASAKTKRQVEEAEDIPLYKEGYGLTIGNVCSQILSIFYLSRLDFYIVHHLKCKYFIRYCDDIIIFHPDREYLKEVYSKIESELEKYELKINKKKSYITNLKNGCIFCGNFVKIDGKKTVVRRCNSSRNKIRKNLNKNYKLYKSGKMSFKHYFCSYSSYNDRVY